MRYTSFTDLHAAVGVLRERGDAAEALALVTEHLDAFSRQTALMYLTEAELLAESGRPTDALGVLDRALAQGCRYRRDWLATNPRLASVVLLAGFSELATRSQQRWDEAAAESKPELTLLVPRDAAPVSGHPLLVVLHGNNSAMTDTLPFWSSAADHGWVTAVPQSSEPAATPGSFTWNDRDKTDREITMHLETINREVHVDGEAIVLAGFSMGALQAIALVITRRIRARAVVPIAPWLPHIREFTALADAGAASIRPTYVVVGSKDPSTPARSNSWRWCPSTAEDPTSTSAPASVMNIRTTCRRRSSARSRSSENDQVPRVRSVSGESGARTGAKPIAVAEGTVMD